MPICLHQHQLEEARLHLLRRAIETGHIGTVKHLLNIPTLRQCVINDVQLFGNWMLCLATEKGNMALVDYFMQPAFTNAKVPTASFIIALQNAARLEHLPMVIRLLSCPNITHDPQFNTLANQWPIIQEAQLLRKYATVHAMSASEITQGESDNFFQWEPLEMITPLLTLLNSDKTLSDETLTALKQCDYTPAIHK